MNQNSFLQEFVYKAIAFTEGMFVLAFVGILFVIIYNLVNPLSNFSEVRDTQRLTEIRQLLLAYQDYLIKNPNNELTNLMSECPTYSKIGIGEDKLNLEKFLVPEYINRIPVDPLLVDGDDTGYGICKKEGGRISIKSFKSEQKTIIVEM